MALVPVDKNTEPRAYGEWFIMQKYRTIPVGIVLRFDTASVVTDLKSRFFSKDH